MKECNRLILQAEMTRGLHQDENCVISCCIIYIHYALFADELLICHWKSFVGACKFCKCHLRFNL